MQIRDFLKPEGILIGCGASDKKSVLDTLVELHDRCGNLKNAAAYYEQVLIREEEGTTAVGGATAIPHAQGSAVRRTGLCAVTLQEGVQWGAPDGGPVQLIFLIAAPGQGSEHLAVLSRLITMLMNKSVARALIRAESPEAFLAILEEEENGRRMEPHKIPMPSPRKYPPDWTNVQTVEFGAEQAFGSQDCYQVLAVVSQNAGEPGQDNGYVYMATQALHSAAVQVGVSIKVETHNREGVENTFTPQEIEQAEAVVIVSDAPVDMTRFDGKHVVRGSLGDGIRSGEKILRRALLDTAPVYHHSTPRQKNGGERVKKEKRAPTRPILSHFLQAGAARVLPFYAAGGLLRFIGFLIDFFMGVSYTESFGYTTPPAALFYTVGTMLFSLALPVLSASIAQAMAGKWAFAPGFTGGLLAATGTTVYTMEDGISAGLFGALLAGLCAGVLVRILQKLFSRLPDGVFGFLYTFLGVLLTGAAVCGVNPLATALYDGSYWLLSIAADNSGVLLGALLGVCVALDMGGPLTQAAHAFAYAQGVPAALAALTTATITVPLAIALACVVFRGRFPMAQRQAGPINFFLGIGGIVQGGIPYAAAAPVRIILGCAVGSAVAGALTAAFACAAASAGGGLLTFGAMTGWIYALLSVTAGTIIGMFLLGALGKVHTPEHDVQRVSPPKTAVLQQNSVL
ncbi:MAG: PTS transporter subunit EIIA [Clostridiales bacterium]|jgi:PTS system fructose-specific IIC component|nr:PTS transporter subunit EIIA [Clostridiales bacterium]